MAKSILELRRLEDGLFRDLESGTECGAADLRRHVAAGHEFRVVGEDGEDCTLRTLAEIMLPGFSEAGGERSSSRGGSPEQLFHEVGDRVRDLAERLADRSTSEEEPLGVRAGRRPLSKSIAAPTARVAAPVEIVRSGGDGAMYRTDRRVAAPLDVVWEQVARLDRLLAAIPGFVVGRILQTDEEGQPVSCEAVWEFASWPFSRQCIPVVATVTSVDPVREFSFSATNEQWGLRVEGSFRLEPLGTEDTDLVYEASFSAPGSKVSRRAIRTLGDLLEAHVHVAADLIAQRAEKMHGARVNLTERSRGAT